MAFSFAAGVAWCQRGSRRDCLVAKVALEGCDVLYKGSSGLDVESWRGCRESYIEIG